jgi:hypothetical protein
MAMTLIGVLRIVGRLVGATETWQVNRHASIAGRVERADSLGVEVRPGRLATEQRERAGLRSLGWRVNDS